MDTLPVKKWCHIALTALLSAYLTFVFLCSPIISALLHQQSAQQLAAYLLCAAGFFSLCAYLLHFMSLHVRHLFEHSSVKGRFSWRVFAGVAAAAFVFYLLYLIAEHPGGFSPDTQWQWEQAHSFAFNDHHPVFHTLLFWLLTRLWDSYTFLLLVQIVAFACGLGYLAATMHAWGFRMPLVLALCGGILLNIATRNLLMFFWKDTALSIFFLFFLSHMFQITLSRGEWLKKPLHWISSAVLLAAITLVRHNAILLTAPLFVLMILSLPRARRACIRLTALALVLVIGVKGPLYSLCRVEPVPSTYLETTGLPMTVLCSAYAYSPDTMPEDALQFMKGVESPEFFASHYQLGNYNSIKWYSDFSEADLSRTPLRDFLKLTWDTVRSNPMLALRSVIELTGIMWNPLGSYYDVETAAYGDPPAAVSIPAQLTAAFSSLFEVMDGILAEQALQKALSQLGILTVLLLVSCYLSIHRFRGWSCLWLVVPLLCYNFGTMLLLSGPDYRFFHFNCLATWPLAVLLLSKPRKAQTETCK